MVAHWWEIWWLISGICCGSLVGDVVAHWWEMLWLLGGRYGGSLVGDVVAAG